MRHWPAAAPETAGAPRPQTIRAGRRSQENSSQNAQSPRSRSRCFRIVTANDHEVQSGRSKPMRSCILFGVLAGMLAGPERPAPAAQPRRADVIVYSGTASGVIAAVAVAREGKTVLLIEPGQHLGGMV